MSEETKFQFEISAKSLVKGLLTVRTKRFRLSSEPLDRDEFLIALAAREAHTGVVQVYEVPD